MRVFQVLLLGIFTLSGVYAQDGARNTVTGTVNDHYGDPAIGASVMVQGTTQGTMTDINGNFSIVAPADATLEVSYVGYVTERIPINGRSNIVINMKVDQSIMLDEVVAIGYGTVRKTDLTGAVTAIKPDELNRGAITSPQQLLQGKVSGVFVQSGKGEPGGGSTMRIRSGASLYASNDPLIVIDGVPIANDGAPGMVNGLSAINPNDIETFTVLKDASATAIYGSRASNGVIIITTKKGLGPGEGKNYKISYNSTYSLSDPHNKIKTLGANEYREIISDVFGDDATAMDLLNMYPDVSTNWQDEIFKTAFSTDQNLSISGNSFDMPYRVSFGYTNEDGTLKTSNYERYSLDISASRKFFNDHLNISLNVKGSINKNVYAEGNAVETAAFYDPTKPVYNDTGEFNGYYNWTVASGGPNTLSASNPLGLLYDKTNTGKTRRSIGNLQLDYKMHFLPELRANLNLGYDVARGEGYGKGDHTGSFLAARDTDFPILGQREDWNNFRRNQLLDFYLNYENEFKEIKSRINVTAGYSWQHFYYSDSNFYYSYPTERFASDPEGWTYYEEDGYYVNESESRRKPKENYLISFFGRLNYSFMERYLLTATLRNDGSSRFAKGNRWGLFPSIALAWTITNEDFMKEQSVLTNLKLRASYGETGQQAVDEDYYVYIPNYIFNTNPNSTYLGNGLLKPSEYNPNLKWETTKTFNVGLDYGFLNNRILGSIEVYQKKTNDLLSKTNVAAGTNFANIIWANIGDMKNKGVEFSIEATPVITKDFSWNVGFNVTWNKSEITNLTVGGADDFEGIYTDDQISAGTGGYIAKHMVGYAPNTFYVFQQVYDEFGKPIQNVFVDRNGDGQITDGDRYLAHSPMPDWYMGFNSRIEYKGFDLGFSLRANIGNYAYNDVAAGNSTVQNAYGAQGFLTNLHETIYRTGFTEANTTAQLFSDYFLENASFLKMDNITLGYSFFNVFSSKLSGRISLSMQNVFTITKYNGIDPEIQSLDGIDKEIWPRPKVYTLGLSLNF
ncbi:MAG: TonB-dependent receptor [Candidatus Azobacteroides sp.]|nr:TonB-dependent receptor [Candidatus Azobacteroides sp.]